MVHLTDFPHHPGAQIIESRQDPQAVKKNV